MNKEEVAILVDDAGSIAEQVKALTPVLRGHKETLTDLFLDRGAQSLPGEIWVAKARISAVYDEISVGDLFDALKIYGKEGELFSCVKVSLSKIKKFLPEHDIAKLRGESVGTKVAVSFTRR